MSRKTKMDNASKLINIISDLMEKQERLLHHIGDLEEYIGTMQIEPSFALWKSDKSAVDVIVDKNGIYDSLKYDKKVGTIWEDWKSNWYGDNLKQIEPSTNDASVDGYIKSLMTTSYDSNSNTKNLSLYFV